MEKRVHYTLQTHKPLFFTVNPMVSPRGVSRQVSRRRLKILIIFRSSAAAANRLALGGGGSKNF